MAINSDLKKFAVFINSKNSIYPSTTKSNVVIPFTANLANHDPLKTMKVAITDVLFSNIFYNIRPGVNSFRYVDVFAAGRNRAASYRVTTVTVPYGYYNYETITQFADGAMGTLNSTVTYTGAGAPVGAQKVFYGFGSTYSGVTTNNVLASDFSLSLAKIWFQTPSLGDMYQAYKSDATLTPSTTESNIYAGRYLIEDSNTYGLLHMLGYSFSPQITTPEIPGTPFRGWGKEIYSREVGSATQYSFDNVNWGTSSSDTTFASIIPTEISDFTGLDDLYIHCPQLRTQYQSSVGKSPNAPNDVVAVVPVTVEFGQKNSFIPNFPLEAFLMNTNITQLQFVMTNSNNVELDFHGIDWSLTMFLEEMTDESRQELENNPDGAMPDSMNFNSAAAAGAYMEGRLKRQRNKNNRFGFQN